MTTGPADEAARVASRLVVGLAGPRLSRREAAWLGRWRPAGVILFARNVTGARQLRGLCAQLRGLLPAGAEIVADHEGGPVSALAAALGRPPAAWTLGLAADPELTRRVHAETATRLREAGLTRALAPVADVLVEPRNPVIGARAFGADTPLVAAHVAAAVRGLREGGVGCCLKHWPGHGGTAGDSHDGSVATAGGALAAPFAAGLAAGADAVMLGHLPAPGRSGLPATLDPEAATRLRAQAAPGRLLLLADDITMGALRDPLAARGVRPGGPDPGHGLVEPDTLPAAWLAQLAAAGCDRLLCRGIPWAALPLPGEPAGDDTPQPEPAASASALEAPPPAAQEGVYTQAHALAARAVGGDPLPAEARELVWLDATGGDRWGDARALVAALERRFGRLIELTAGGWPAEAAARALLVTSHRPLAPETVAALGATAPAGPGGCLALGHPSLAADLRAALPDGWRISGLPEPVPAACAALWGPPRGAGGAG